MDSSRVVCIVQARCGSSRFPGKVLKEICGKPLIGLLVQRLAEAKELDDIVLATTELDSDDRLISYAKQIGVNYSRGSENDLISRYLKAAEEFRADVIVRITGDCPAVDPSLVDKCIRLYLKKGVDYLSNANPPTFPDGLDISIFSIKALRYANEMATTAYDREHIVPFLKKAKNLSSWYYINDIDYSNIRITVDEPEDLAVLSALFEYFGTEKTFGMKEIVDVYHSRPDIFEPNRSIGRNEGAAMSKGAKWWKRAQRVIPGGNHLLSKRPDMFLPNRWPEYFDRAKGCHVWDLDNQKYLDMSIMGIGTNILGYGDEVVDAAVRDVIDKGNMSTLNCPEEVELAEKLIHLHPWADMARFARTGGEANALAVRIARAATGKDVIGVCGYHGWHDWYLSANLDKDKNLDGHLLPGLEPNGVPRALAGTTVPFEYNSFEEVDRVLNTEGLAAIKMEVMRNTPPLKGYLEYVRKQASRLGVVLIFDECTSGFRECFGGLHKKFGINPDMALFGKALGNGYAITAVLGREDIMQHAQSTFISSTFWTERIGPAAALKTLERMEEEESWKAITSTGEYLKACWSGLAVAHDLDIETFGMDALAKFRINSSDNIKYKTYITQELLKKGILGSNMVYVSLAHQRSLVDKYLECLDKIFSDIRACEDGKDINSLLETDVCSTGFSRLN